MRPYLFALTSFAVTSCLFAVFPRLTYADLSLPTTTFRIENFADFEGEYYFFTMRKNAKKYGVNLVRGGDLGSLSRETELYVLPKRELGTLDELRQMGLEKIYARLKKEKPIPIVWDSEAESKTEKSDGKRTRADSASGFGAVGKGRIEVGQSGSTVYFRLEKKSDGTFILRRIAKDSGLLRSEQEPRFAAVAGVSLSSLATILALLWRRRKA